MQDEDFRVTVPSGTSGEWSIDRFEVTADALPSQDHKPGEQFHVPVGTYTRLIGPYVLKAQRTFGYGCWMSDVPSEIAGHREVVRRAQGRVLITGLGLGMVVQACLRNPKVQHVTVLESDPDVIALSGPHYLASFPGRVEIVCNDAFAWQPPKGTPPWDVIWHDVWPTIDPENVREMVALRRRFARWCTGWQGCWEEVTCRAMLHYRQHEQRDARKGKLAKDGSLTPASRKRLERSLSKAMHSWRWHSNDSKAAGSNAVAEESATEAAT